MSLRNKIEGRSNIYLTLTLLVLLLAVYTLTYSGTFISDDEHILASRCLSLAFDDWVNDRRVYGNSRVYALANLAPIYAAQGVNIEPGQTLAGSVLARLAALLGVGRVQTLFLLNIWVTAFTAVIISGMLIFLGYSKSTAFLSALLFGLGTAAWPYAKTFFRDSLAMMFLTGAWASGLVLSKSARISWRWILALLICAAAGVLTKNTISIALPVLLIFIVTARYQRNPQGSLLAILRVQWQSILFWGCSILLGLYLWVKLLPPDGIFARYSLAYYQTLMEFFFTTPHPQFFEALAGPLLSPGKSIFIYSPILLLSVLGLVKNRDVAWPTWLYALLLIVFQALFYDGEWWGHINWGLRFMLPAIPLLVVTAAPVVDAWLHTRAGRLRLLILSLISMLVQVIGVLPPLREFYTRLSDINPTELEMLSLWTFKHSPVFWNIKWILSGGSWDLAAVRIGIQSLPIALGFGGIIAILLLGLFKIKSAWLPVGCLVLTIGLTAMLVVIYAGDQTYHFSRTDLAAAGDKIAENIIPNDHVIIKAYGTPGWYYWMNWADPQTQWTALPFHYPSPGQLSEYEASRNPEVALDDISLALMREQVDSAQRIWLVLPNDSPGADLEIEAEWLEVRSSSSNQWAFTGDEFETTLYLFVIH